MTTWTDARKAEATDSICSLIMQGNSLRKACKGANLPAVSTFMKWTLEDGAIAEQYARAREARADSRADEIDEIVDLVKTGELKPDAARVMIDAHKWQAGKENSKRYGDKIDVNGNFSVTATDDQLNSRLAHLLGKAGIARTLGGEGTPEETA